MNQYNQWLSSNNGPSSSSNHKPTPTATPIMGSTKTGNNTALQSPSSSTTNISGKTLSSPATPMTAAKRNSLQDKKLMWCINLGSRLTLVSSLEIPAADNDAAIFQKLRAKYWKIRGWRGWLSLYSISDIKFVKV